MIWVTHRGIPAHNIFDGLEQGPICPNASPQLLAATVPSGLSDTPPSPLGSGSIFRLPRPRNDYNLNAFSLFDSEETLLETMWFREQILRKSNS